MALPMALTVNSTAARSMALRRPKRSLRAPAKAAPKMQPIRALLAAKPLAASLSPKWALSGPIAPETTAVS